MVSTQLLIIIGLALLILFFLGLAFILEYLIRKIQSLLKPKVPLRVRDPEVMAILIKSIRGLSFEERLLALRVFFGDYDCYIKVDSDGIVIKGIGQRIIQDDELSESIG